MKATPKPRQLNIRSDEAYHLAHALSRRERRSAQEIVIAALRRYAEAASAPGDAEQLKSEAEYARIMAFAERIRHEFKPDAVNDHTDMYDEHGLPV
jgi:hypothetical protein